ncbi:MAG: circadian clock protein KaiC [Promethearchaeota archaeon]|nr:MAG: circadian clock protein KaiC [Candidatus Lokiarchaeota archaeon]
MFLMKGIEKIPSGIDGFDIISMGGIPKNRTTLISGTPGSGKTIFCTQFLLGGILNSKEPGVFVTFEERPEDIITNMTDFGWDIPNYEDSGLWKFVDVSLNLGNNFEISGIYDLSGLLIRIKTAVEMIGAKRVVLDSLAALFSRFPDKTIVRDEILRLKSCLNSLAVTSLITTENYNDYGDNNQYNIIDFVSDNVIVLNNSLSEEYRRRTIEILKYRGTNHKKGKHSFTIKQNRGVVIISFKRELEAPQIQRKRKSSGVKELNSMIGGGFFEGSAILISGQTGTGKTLLSISILEGIIQKKEKCVMFNFEESREQIFHKARIWGIDLEQAENENIFRLMSVYPESEGIEDLIVDIKTVINEFTPVLIILDSISALERITSKLTYRESLINLFLFLREKNIMGIFTSTTPTFSKPFFVSEKHISTLSDAIILLHFFEKEGKLTRGLGILKMRDSEHAKNFYEYSIDNTGFHILQPLKSNAGLFDQIFL